VAEWSRLLPPGDAPPAIETALREVEALKARLPAQRQALSDAQAAASRVAAADRERMAGELRAGRTPKADAAGVAKAEQRVASVRREGEALTLAIQGAEDALGDAVRAHQGEWLEAARRAESAARTRSRELIEALRATLEDLSRARVTAHWIENGLPREQVAPNVTLGMLGASASITANHDPVAVSVALDWLTQTVAEPEAHKPAPEPRPLRPIQIGAYAGQR
jgi:hypothetical protein